MSSTEGLSSKGNPLMLFLFSDQLEVCKKRSKAFNSAKSPNTINGLRKNSIKPYKHVKLMSLNTIKRVIDIKETEECQRVFSLVFRNNDEVKERLCSFVMTDDEVDKQFFIETLCKQMAANACTANTVRCVVVYILRVRVCLNVIVTFRSNSWLSWNLAIWKSTQAT